MTAANPETWLRPVCARVSVRYGATCPHKSADAWECEHLADSVNEVQATYYVRLWREKRKEGGSMGIARLAE